MYWRQYLQQPSIDKLDDVTQRALHEVTAGRDINNLDRITRRQVRAVLAKYIVRKWDQEVQADLQKQSATDNMASHCDNVVP